jgi:hypothetical protein
MSDFQWTKDARFGHFLRSWKAPMLELMLPCECGSTRCVNAWDRHSEVTRRRGDYRLRVLFFCCSGCGASRGAFGWVETAIGEIFGETWTVTQEHGDGL